MLLGSNAAFLLVLSHTLSRQVEFLPVMELTAEVARLPAMADADEELTEALAVLLYDWSKKVGRRVHRIRSVTAELSVQCTGYVVSRQSCLYSAHDTLCTEGSVVCAGVLKTALCVQVY